MPDIESPIARPKSKDTVKRAMKYAHLYEREGMTMREIAERAGVTHQRVQQMIRLVSHHKKKFPRTKGQPRRPWTTESVTLIRKLWAEGRSTSEIARATGYSVNSVIGKAYREGLARRPSPIRRRLPYA